jgi:hypothetical protein
MTEQQRVASALIKAGINNPAVWEPTGTTPQNPLEARPYSAPVSELVRDAADRKADAGAGDFDPRPPLVMMKGTEDSPFLISPRSPRDLARSRGWKPALLVWKSPILTRNARQASSFGAEKDGAEDRGGEK